MKKIILSLLAVGMLSSAANAQLRIAPELGLNMANMAIKGTSTTMKAGAALGAVIDFSLTDNLTLQPGLFYMMNGASMTGGSISVNTIQIPINVIYLLGDEGDNRFFFGAGPYLGYNIGGNIKPSGGSSTSLNIGSDKLKDDIKAMDFGLGVNVGYLLASGLFFRAHYQTGLAELSPQDGGSIKTSGIGVTAGYYFGAKKDKKSKGGKK